MQAFKVTEGRPDIPVLVLCDHASHALPLTLGTLGTDPDIIKSHYGWDIHALETALGIAGEFGAALVHTCFSRLMIDCNRPLDSPELIREEAGVMIPGNCFIPEDQRRWRISDVFMPYHACISTMLDSLCFRHSRVLLVSIHTFTPRLYREVRPWDIGISYWKRSNLPDYMIGRLKHETKFFIGVHKPYKVHPKSDYTLLNHHRPGIESVQIEIRQDLLDDAALRETIIEALARSVSGYAWDE